MNSSRLVLATRPVYVLSTLNWTVQIIFAVDISFPVAFLMFISAIGVFALFYSFFPKPWRTQYFRFCLPALGISAFFIVGILANVALLGDWGGPALQAG